MNRAEVTTVAESELQRALDCGELVERYQPVVDVVTGRLAQVETLLRWNHPERGLLAPGEFLVDADDSTLLVRIGWSVVIEAARRAGEWRERYPERPLTVTVNLFDDHLERRDLPDRVEHLLLDHLVAVPGGLAFEVGEHHFVSRGRRARDRLAVLRNVGAQVVIDDFGAAAAADDDATPDALRDWAVDFFGASRSYPLDGVKLDPRLVHRLATDDRLRSVVDAGHAAGVWMVALAVEDDATATRARRVGFDLAQGFHFARPEPPARIDARLDPR